MPSILKSFYSFTNFTVPAGGAPFNGLVLDATNMGTPSSCEIFSTGGSVGTVTVQLQASNDFTNASAWIDISGGGYAVNSNAPFFVTVPQYARYYRCVITTNSGGNSHIISAIFAPGNYSPEVSAGPPISVSTPGF